MGWSTLGLVGQKAHLLSSGERFPLEVERRLRGVATKALVDGFHEVDVGLNLGHAAPRLGRTSQQKSSDWRPSRRLPKLQPRWLEPMELLQVGRPPRDHLGPKRPRPQPKMVRVCNRPHMPVPRTALSRTGRARARPVVCP